jgi:hypothetical protein
LENYLKGTLSPEETDRVRLRLETEPALQEDLELLKALVAGTRATALQEKMKMLKDLEKDQSKDTKAGFSFLWPLIVLFLALAGYFLYQFTIKEKKAADTAYAYVFQEAFDNQLILHKTLRSAVQTDTLTTAQRRAYELYSLQLFDEAAPLLNTLWQEKKDTLALFYLGVSQVGMGQTQKGLKTLQRQELKKYQKQINLFSNQEK